MTARPQGRSPPEGSAPVGRNRHRCSVLCWFIFALCSCSGGATKKPVEVPPPVAFTELQLLLPGDLDVVARVDWERARREGVDDTVVGTMTELGVTEPFLKTFAGCLEKTSILWAAARLGSAGVGGDPLVVLRPQNPPDGPSNGRVGGGAPSKHPCGATGWRAAPRPSTIAAFEPEHPSPLRGDPALTLVSKNGTVMVVSNGQVDAVLRVLRDGPDAERLDPAASGFVSLEARIDEPMLPVAWRQRAPTVTALARGLHGFRATIDLGERIRCRVVLSFVEKEDAKEASARLKKLRDALTRSKRPSYQDAAKGARATIVDDVIRVEFEIPRVESEGGDDGLL